MAITNPAPLLPNEPDSHGQQPPFEGISERQIRTARAAGLPDPTGICCSVAQAAVEAIFGTRPVQQLSRLVSPEVYSGLSARAFAQISIDHANGVSRVASKTVPRQRISNHVGSGVSNAPVRIIRARVLRLSSIAAEATVIIHDGHKVRATALRVEEFRGRWRVNVLNIG